MLSMTFRDKLWTLRKECTSFTVWWNHFPCLLIFILKIAEVVEPSKGLWSSFNSLCFSFDSESMCEWSLHSYLNLYYLSTHWELLTICEGPMVFTPPGFYSPYISGMPFTWAIFLFILHDKTQILSLMHSKNVCWVVTMFQAHLST